MSGTGLDVVAIPEPGLGNHSYLVGLGDDSAVIIDPVRDPAVYHERLAAHGWRLRAAVETHLHADFVSGSLELAAESAEVMVPAAGEVAFRARGLVDGDEVDLSGLTLVAIATPGHTPEHLSYLLRDGATPLALFSGGALIPGGIARPDLLGPDETEPLARAAYRSLHERLLVLPDELPVHATHGPGSFCSAGGGTQATTTIGAEKAANPLVDAADEDDFVSRLLGGLGTYPAYFLELREVNRAGPLVYGSVPPPLQPLQPAGVQRAVEAGAELVDVRPVDAFAAAHVPGSLSIPLRDAFATWLGWLVERHRDLVFVADEHTEVAGLVRACLKIGYERLVGVLAGGVDAWRQAGHPVATLPLTTGEDAGEGRGVLDVRQASEWAEGHVDGAAHVELGSLAARAPELAGTPLLVHCGHGERAMTAASLLARAGHRDVAVLEGGPGELARATGRRLVRE